MNVITPTAMHLSGMLAIIGTCLYTIGDKLLFSDHLSPIYQVENNGYPIVRLLNVITVFPWWRLVWSRLLGIFAAPLMLAGIWQVYQGLSPAGPWLALPPALLLVYATVIERTFVYSPFIERGETVQTVIINDNLGLYRTKVLQYQKAQVLREGHCIGVYVMLASLWFAVAVASGQTHFPIWMTVVNPVTVTLLYLASKSFMPKRLAALTEGVGFNVAYLIFFTLTTVTLW